MTTFSSWILQVVVMLVGAKPLTSSKWVEGLFALALNVLVCMAALVTGQHACLSLYNWCGPRRLGGCRACVAGAEQWQASGALSGMRP